VVSRYLWSEGVPPDRAIEAPAPISVPVGTDVEGGVQ